MQPVMVFLCFQIPWFPWAQKLLSLTSNISALALNPTNHVSVHAADWLL